MLNASAFYQLVADFVCLLSGAGQVEYCGFIRAFSLKIAAAQNAAIRAVRVNQNSKVVGHKTKMLCKAERNCRVVKGDLLYTVSGSYLYFVFLLEHVYML